MSDIKKTFNELALESILFKGQKDWYFCFLKAERIAHVLAILSDKLSDRHNSWFFDLVDEAAELPPQVAYFSAGDIDIQIVLAAIFSLISGVRISSTRGFIAKDTAHYIEAEYEHMIERLAGATTPSPFISPQDFSVPDFLSLPRASLAAPKEPKGVQVGEMGDRSARILDFVLKNKAVSIKDICTILPEYSEKTVQRELSALIARGLIKREGERRWSVYKPA